MTRKVASYEKLTTTNWQQSLKLIILQLHKTRPKNSTLTSLQSFGIWRKLERWKSSRSECLKNWPQIKKKSSPLSVVFSYSMQQWIISQLDCEVWWKADFYTTSNKQVSGWTEKQLQSTSQSQTCTKKGSWSLSGGLLVVWSTTAFWITAEPLHLRSMPSKSMRWMENCNTYSWHWSIKGPNSFLRQHPTTGQTTNASKIEQIGQWSFGSSAIFTWPLTNWLTLLQVSQQLFTGKMLPQPTGCRKCFPRVCQILKHAFLCFRNKIYFSLAKMCWF